MQIEATGFVPNDKKPVSKIETSDTKSNERINELRRKIQSGFYDSKEVLMKIVSKLVNEI